LNDKSKEETLPSDPFWLAPSVERQLAIPPDAPSAVKGDKFTYALPIFEFRSILHAPCAFSSSWGFCCWRRDELAVCNQLFIDTFEIFPSQQQSITLNDLFITNGSNLEESIAKEIRNSVRRLKVVHTAIHSGKLQACTIRLCAITAVSRKPIHLLLRIMSILEGIYNVPTEILWMVKLLTGEDRSFPAETNVDEVIAEAAYDQAESKMIELKRKKPIPVELRKPWDSNLAKFVLKHQPKRSISQEGTFAAPLSGSPRIPRRHSVSSAYPLPTPLPEFIDSNKPVAVSIVNSNYIEHLRPPPRGPNPAESNVIGISNISPAASANAPPTAIEAPTHASNINLESIDPAILRHFDSAL